MPNLIVISLIIFLVCMWGLIVRDKCESLVKNQVSRLIKWISRLAHDYLARSLPVKRATYRAHNWKMKSHARLDFSRLFHG